MNSIQVSRIINNFITDLKLNNDFLIKIQQIINNTNITLDNVQNHNIMNEIYQYHYQQLISQYKDIKSYINDAKLKEKLFKKYSYTFAQQEIQNNMNFAIGEQTNNLSFTSQDVDYRSAPIVIYRLFSKDKTTYEDKIWIGKNGQHHDHFLNIDDNIIQDCTDKQGQQIFACLYLYQDDIVYISKKDVNYYGDTDILVNILKQKFPRPLKGIFEVTYGEDKRTVRLARKIGK